MNEPPVTSPPPAPPTTPARRTRRLRLSGKWSAALLVACFVLTAVLIPMALRLPRWVAFEVVLAAWWAIWLGVLTWLLYTGQRVADDHQLREPRSWFASEERRPPRQDPDSAWWDGFWWGWWFDGDAVLVILGLILLVGLIWVLFEVAIPLLLFLLYFIARGSGGGR